MAARKFKLPTSQPLRTAGVLLVLTVGVSLIGGHWLSTSSAVHDFWTDAVLVGALTGGGPLLVALFLVMREWSKPSPRSVDVGTDGVLVGARFIPYSDMGGVEHVRQQRNADGSEGEVTWYEWTLAIKVGGLPGGGALLGGETVNIMKTSSQTDDGDSLGASIARAIDESMAAWVAGQRSADLAVDIARRDRTASEWVKALRGLGSGAAASYRSATADAEKLSRLLDDPQGKPSARAAAAIVLTASGDKTAAQKLRIAAETMVEGSVRIALENIADETAVAEALEILEGVDRQRDARVTRS